jgi:hypothetical protein
MSPRRRKKGCAKKKPHKLAAQQMVLADKIYLMTPLKVAATVLIKQKEVHGRTKTEVSFEPPLLARCRQPPSAAHPWPRATHVSLRRRKSEPSKIRLQVLTLAS